MGLKLHTAPTVEPVTTDEAKAHLRVDHDEDDDLIDALIVAARTHCEEYVQRSFIETRWTYTLDKFPCDGVIRLPRPPFIAAVSLAYVDTAGDSQSLNVSTGFISDAVSEPGRLTPLYGEFWPSTRAQPNAITIVHKAGYGTAATSVPGPLKQAVLLLVGHWYENRETVNVGNIVSELPFTVKALLDPFKMWEYR